MNQENVVGGGEISSPGDLKIQYGSPDFESSLSSVLNDVEETERGEDDFSAIDSSHRNSMIESDYSKRIFEETQRTNSKLLIDFDEREEVKGAPPPLNLNTASLKQINTAIQSYRSASITPEIAEIQRIKRTDRKQYFRAGRKTKHVDDYSEGEDKSEFTIPFKLLKRDRQA